MNRDIDPILIDRLVDGELGPDERGDLLRRLDASPDGWRRCALAFLEGREFGLAARAWASEHAPDVAESPGKRAVPPSHRRGRSPARFVRAASVVGLAFLAGFAARGRATDGRDDRPAVPPSVPALAKLDPAPPAPPVTTSAPEPPPMPEYVKAQWTRLGYQVERKRKLISMEEDGRTLTIPVDGYRLEFVGRPTY